jgi:glutamate/aspartate transport system substrate-binding protein
MVETDRAMAFAMDDILLFGLAAGSKSPSDYVVSNDALSVEPYGIMVRKDDTAFKKIADAAITALFKSGEINKIYGKWFQSSIPPKNINLNLPMGDKLKAVIAKPTDSGDATVY